MGGECASLFSVIEAASTRCRVFGVDYRNPPDHPYPAALDDSVAVYRELLSYPPSKLAFTGVSGGGNLAAAVPLKVRDLGMPLPAAVGLFTPEVDPTESGDTFQTNRDIDVVLPTGIRFTLRSTPTVMICEIRMCHPFLATSPGASRPRLFNPERATSSSPTP